MPSVPLRCSCPNCDARLTLKDRGLAGKRIKCPKCQKPFLVEPAEENEIVEAPRKKAPKSPPPDEDGDEVQDESPRKKKKKIDDEEETEDRPSRKKKKRKRKGSALPWILAGGGVVVIAAVAIVLVVILNKNSGGPGPVAGQVANQDKKADNASNKVNTPLNPDLLVDVSGPWPEPMSLPGVIAPDAAVVIVHIVLTGDSYKISKMEVGKTEKAIRDHLLALAGKGVGHIGASDDAPDGAARLMSMRMGPMKEGAQDFAKKIDFGTVRSVTDQVITLVVRKESVAGLKAAP